MPKKLIFDDAALMLIVKASTSFWQVARALRPERPDGIYKSAQRRIIELGLDVSHFDGQGPRPTRWSNDDLRRVVAASTSTAQVIRGLGLIPAGGNYDQINRRVKALQIDTSHFNGKGPSVLKGRTFKRYGIERSLVAGRWRGSHHLKNRLIREGLKKAECEICGWAMRAPDGRIPIELDHINGDTSDNRLENLRVLCPNCHSLQPTHRGLNRKTRRATTAGELVGYPHAASGYSLSRSAMSGCRTWCVVRDSNPQAG